MVNANAQADLLYGVPAIAAHMGVSSNVVYHLTRREDFPSFKIGGKVCARRSDIDLWITKMAEEGKTS